MKLNSENTNVNIRHLRALHAIWEEGSFGKAADRLGVVPSSLSETVRQAEEAAGGALFDRSQRPPTPTALGLAFLEDTVPVLDALDASLRRLKDRVAGKVGLLRIGASPSAISERIAPAIRRFRDIYPDTRIEVHDTVAESLADMVASGALDLAVAGRARTSADIIQTELDSDPVGLACSVDDPLAAYPDLYLRDIAPERLIHLGNDTGTARLIQDAAQIPDALKRGALECHSTIGQLCLIRSNLGVALLPRNAVLVFNDPLIRFLSIADLDLTRRLFLLRQDKGRLSPAAQDFIACLTA